MKTTSMFLASSVLATTLLTGLSTGTASAQELAGPGWALTSNPMTFGAARATLTDGSYIEFDGTTLAHFDSGGGLIQNLAATAGFKFPSFLEILPGEATALFGESSVGNIYEVDLVNGGMTLLTNIGFNYDVELDATPGFAYISGAPGGFGTGTDIFRVDLTSGAQTRVVHVGGPSGAVTVNDVGDLFYVTQFDSWPIPPLSSSILRWDDAELVGVDPMTPLTEADADIVVPALTGGTGMRYASATDSLFVLDTDFAGGLSKVARFNATTGIWKEDVATSPLSLTGLQIFPGSGSAVLAGFQPIGAHLRFNVTDFGNSMSSTLVVDPARPIIAFSGPAPGVAGVATVTITGAMPNAGVRVATTHDEFQLGAECVHHVGLDIPYHLAFQPIHLIRRSQPLATDPFGTMVLTYNQPAGFGGQIVFQGLLEDASGAPLGTSEAILNN
tara:strand:- start:2044 stop:3375 length:1332 start_codon:yes stop_codon:yes gene_type:complete